MPTDLTKELTAERDALRAENENLRGQLAAAGAARPAAAAPVEHRFMLSEGDRQELELRGVVNIGGRQYTTAEVRKLLAADPRLAGVEIADAPAATETRVAPTRLQGHAPGVDFVWPSVAPGAVDPAVAGTPGINGPAASDRK